MKRQVLSASSVEQNFLGLKRLIVSNTYLLLIFNSFQHRQARVWCLFLWYFKLEVSGIYGEASLFVLIHHLHFFLSFMTVQTNLQQLALISPELEIGAKIRIRVSFIRQVNLLWFLRSSWYIYAYIYIHTYIYMFGSHITLQLKTGHPLKLSRVELVSTWMGDSWEN